MCEGVLYSGIDIRLASGEIVRLDRLVLLHPETTDCASGDPYWAMLAVSEAFSPRKTGQILGHAYSIINVGPLKAFEIDLTLATDKRMGFAADGKAYIGQVVIMVKFPNSIPEDLHLKSFCDDAAKGFALISLKELRFQ